MKRRGALERREFLTNVLSGVTTSGSCLDYRVMCSCHRDAEGDLAAAKEWMKSKMQSRKVGARDPMCGGHVRLQGLGC